MSGTSGITPPPKVQSPLNLSGVGDIIEASGLGAQKHLSSSQFPQPELPGEPGAPAEGAGAGEAAGGAAAAEELLPLVAL